MTLEENNTKRAFIAEVDQAAHETSTFLGGAHEANKEPT